MRLLYTNKPKRLFTFGCSYTKFLWSTWAEIIAYDLNVPLYNYGYSGAGYQYIFNSMMQADNYYNFNKDDLVIVNFSHPLRQDIFKEGRWDTMGSIYKKSDAKLLEKYFSDYTGSILIGLSIVKATIEFLQHRKCQFHIMSMADINIDFDIDVANIQNIITKPDIHREIQRNYKTYIDQICDSFFKVLWNNDIENKYKSESASVCKYYLDGHPLVSEHYEYLKRTFEYEFKVDTDLKVRETNESVVNLLKQYNETYNKKNKTFCSWDVFNIPEFKTKISNTKMIKSQNELLFTSTDDI